MRQAELLLDALLVGVDGLGRDAELPPDLRSVEAARGEPHDRALAIAQSAEPETRFAEGGGHRLLRRRQLGITAKTVDTYKQRIEQKLGLTHRTDYVRFALDAQLLHAGR
jgi:hypothetical protein